MSRLLDLEAIRHRHRLPDPAAWHAQESAELLRLKIGWAVLDGTGGEA